MMKMEEVAEEKKKRKTWTPFGRKCKISEKRSSPQGPPEASVPQGSLLNI